MLKKYTIREFVESELFRDVELENIADVARHFSWTPQGLHWYEKRNLISPVKENKFRKYSSEDLAVLSCIKFYREMGFSVEEVKELLEAGLDDSAQMIAFYSQARKMDIKKQQEKINILDQRLLLMSGFYDKENDFYETASEPFYFKQSLRAKGQKSEKANAMIKRWAEEIPFAQYVLLSAGGSALEYFSGHVGIMLPEKYLSFVSSEILEEIESDEVPFFKSEKVLQGLVRISHSNREEDMVQVLDQVKAAAGQFEGAMLMRPIACHRAKGSQTSYHEVSFTLRS